MDDVDLTRLQLDVYMTRQGPWNPDHGDLEIPESWDFLPSGDAFVTRRVKATGTFWMAWRPRGPGKGGGCTRGECRRRRTEAPATVTGTHPRCTRQSVKATTGTQRTVLVQVGQEVQELSPRL
jgi:hypothetical protein